MTTVTAFVRRDYLQWASYRFGAVWTTFRLVITVFTIYLVGKTVGSSPSELIAKYDTDYTGYLLTAITFMEIWSAGFVVSGALRQNQAMGTLEAMMLSPYGIYRLVLYSSAFPILMQVVRLLGFIFISVVVLGQWHDANILTATVVFLLALGAMGCTGVLSAAFLLVIKQGDPIIAIYTLANGIMAGVFFPPQLLPEWVQVLSAFLPLTHALEGMRLALLQGAGLDRVVYQVMMLLAMFLIQLPLTFLALRWAIAQAKQEGSLVQY